MLTNIHLFESLQPSKLKILKAGRNLGRISSYTQLKENKLRHYIYRHYASKKDEKKENENIFKKPQQKICRDEKKVVLRQYQLLDTLRRFSELNFMTPSETDILKDDDEDEYSMDINKKDLNKNLESESFLAPLTGVTKKKFVHSLQNKYNKNFTPLPDNILELQMRNMSSGKSTPSIRIPIPNPSIDSQNSADSVVLNITINIPINDLAAKQREENMKILSIGNSMPKLKAANNKEKENMLESTQSTPKLSCYQKLDLSISKSLSKFGFGDNFLKKKNVQQNNNNTSLLFNKEHDRSKTYKEQKQFTTNNGIKINVTSNEIFKNNYLKTDKISTSEENLLKNSEENLRNTKTDVDKSIECKICECRKIYLNQKKKNLDEHIKKLLTTPSELPEKTDMKNNKNMTIVENKSNSAELLIISKKNQENENRKSDTKIDSPFAINQKQDHNNTKLIPIEKKTGEIITQQISKEKITPMQTDVNNINKNTSEPNIISRSIIKTEESVLDVLNKSSKNLSDKNQNESSKVKLANLKQNALTSTSYTDLKDASFSERKNLKPNVAGFDFKNMENTDDFLYLSLKKPSKLSVDEKKESILPKVNLIPNKEKDNSVISDKKDERTTPSITMEKENEFKKNKKEQALKNSNEKKGSLGKINVDSSCPKSFSDIFNNINNNDNNNNNNKNIDEKDNNDIIKDDKTNKLSLLTLKSPDSSVKGNSLEQSAEIYKEKGSKLSESEFNRERAEFIENNVKQFSGKSMNLKSTNMKKNENDDDLTEKCKVQNFLDWRKQCRDIVYPEDEMSDINIVQSSASKHKNENNLKKTKKEFGTIKKDEYSIPLQNVFNKSFNEVKNTELKLKKYTPVENKILNENSKDIKNKFNITGEKQPKKSCVTPLNEIVNEIKKEFTNEEKKNYDDRFNTNIIDEKTEYNIKKEKGIKSSDNKLNKIEKNEEEKSKTEKLLNLNKLTDENSKRKDTIITQRLKKEDTFSKLASPVFDTIRKPKFEQQNLRTQKKDFTITNKNDNLQNISKNNLRENELKNIDLDLKRLNKKFQGSNFIKSEIKKKLQERAEENEDGRIINNNTKDNEVLKYNVNIKNELDLKREELITKKTAEFCKILLELVKLFSISAINDIERGNREKLIQELKTSSSRGICKFPLPSTSDSKLSKPSTSSKSSSSSDRNLELINDESPLRKNCKSNIDNCKLSTYDKE